MPSSQACVAAAGSAPGPAIVAAAEGHGDKHQPPAAPRIETKFDNSHVLSEPGLPGPARVDALSSPTGDTEQRHASALVCDTRVGSIAQPADSDVKSTDALEMQRGDAVKPAPDAVVAHGTNSSGDASATPLDADAGMQLHRHDATTANQPVEAVPDTATARAYKLEPSPPLEAGVHPPTEVVHVHGPTRPDCYKGQHEETSSTARSAHTTRTGTATPTHSCHSPHPTQNKHPPNTTTSPNSCTKRSRKPSAGNTPDDSHTATDPQHAAGTCAAAGDAAPLGRGRRARKLTTKLVAAGPAGIAALGRAPPPPAAAPRAKAPKRPRDTSPENKGSPDTAAGGSCMTVAFVRPPTPPAAKAAAPTAPRAKRGRKGNPARASE